MAETPDQGVVAAERTRPVDAGAANTVWRHQGLNFEAPFAVGDEVASGSVADVVVRVDSTKSVGTGSPGPVVAELRERDRSVYTVYETAGDYLVRFHGTCEFWVSRDATQVRCEPGPRCADGMVPVLMVGTVTAVLLTLRGYAVLHASAVRWNDQTVLLAGPSGKGKTTVAALCCAAGAEFVTDDVVTLVTVGGEVACLGLGSELRLRGTAAGIADLFPPPGPPSRRTADNRLAIRPDRASTELNVISAVVLPQPARGIDRASIRALVPSAAAVQLLANSRIPAMVPLSMQKPFFEAVADLAGAVPVMEARVPWGPPFTTAVVLDLLDRLTGASAG